MCVCGQVNLPGELREPCYIIRLITHVSERDYVALYLLPFRRWLRAAGMRHSSAGVCEYMVVIRTDTSADVFQLDQGPGWERWREERLQVLSPGLWKTPSSCEERSRKTKAKNSPRVPTEHDLMSGKSHNQNVAL